MLNLDLSTPFAYLILVVRLWGIPGEFRALDPYSYINTCLFCSESIPHLTSFCIMARKPVRSLSFIASDIDSSNDADDFEAFEDDFDDEDR